MGELRDFTYKEIESILEYNNLGIKKPVGLMKRIYNKFKKDSRYLYDGDGYHGISGVLPLSCYLVEYKGIVSYSKDLDVALRFANVREFKKTDLTTNTILKRRGKFFDFSRWLKDWYNLHSDDIHMKILLDRFIGESEIWCIWDREELTNNTIETLDWTLLRNRSNLDIIKEVLGGKACKEDCIFFNLNVSKYCDGYNYPFVVDFIKDLNKIDLDYMNRFKK